MSLPLHPLIVHLVVVFIPLAVLGQFFVLFVRKSRPAYAPLVSIAASIGAVSSIAAKMAGGALVAKTGHVPLPHAVYGRYLTYAAIVFALLNLVWFFLERRTRTVANSTPSIAVTVLGYLAALAGLVALVFTVLAGHSGAAAVWMR